MNIFERASRAKLRFETNKGFVSTEELWDLNLTSLDNLFKKVNKKLKESTEESFIATKSKADTESELQIEILKHIMTSKIATEEAAKKRAETNAKIAHIEELIVAKQSEELGKKSVEDLSAMLAELKA